MQHVIRAPKQPLEARGPWFHLVGGTYNSAWRRGFVTQPFPIDAQPTTPNEDGSKTLRIRQNGNRSLPVSPIMDPIAVGARERHKKPKSRDSADEETMSSFSQELSKNEFAHALATPVRRCNITRARLPTHFLIPFVAKIPAADSLTSVDREQRKRPTLIPAASFKPKVPASYVLATEEILGQLDGRKNGKWAALITDRVRKRYDLRMRKKSDRTKISKGWDFTFDGKLPHLVHDKLSAVVVRNVRWCLEAADGPLIVPLPMEGSKGLRDVAGLIRLRTTESDEPPQAGRATVYDAEDLLVEEQLHLLRDMFKRETPPETDAIAILRHPKTAITLMSLDKLQNYLALRARKTT